MGVGRPGVAARYSQAQCDLDDVERDAAAMQLGGQLPVGPSVSLGVLIDGGNASAEHTS